MYKLVLEKAEEPEIKLPTSADSWKKQESSRKTSISALLTMPKPLTMWITINYAKSRQSCPTLCYPMDYIVHGILQARILEWVAFPFSGDLPNPGIEPRSPALQADSLLSEPPGKPMS